MTPMQTKIYVATVTHKHGTDVFCGLSEAEQFAKLAAWCRAWWDETERPSPPPDDDNLCIDEYFEALDGLEYADYSEDTVTLLDSCWCDDLLEACKLCEAVLAEHEQYDSGFEGEDSREGEAAKAARAAIAKATGCKCEQCRTKKAATKAVKGGGGVRNDPNYCPKNTNGGHHHEPDWSSVSIEPDGDEMYIDVNCLHCGRSGCVGTKKTLAAGIDWS